MDQSAKAGVIKPIILVIEANIWCAKITVMAKWAKSVGQGLYIKLNKDKTKCRNIHIGLDLAVFLCLQKYANVLGDMLRLMEWFE